MWRKTNAPRPCSRDEPGRTKANDGWNAPRGTTTPNVQGENKDHG